MIQLKTKCSYQYCSLYTGNCPACSTSEVKTTSRSQRAKAATRKLASSLKLMATALKDLLVLVVKK